MIFYVSGNYNDEGQIIDYLVARDCAVLTSFAYPKILQFRTRALAAKLRASGKRMLHMLDSGAFTAWVSGKMVDLPDLIRTCNMLQDRYSDCMDWTFISLDVIPGFKGTDPTPDDLRTAWVQSARNYQTMCRQVQGHVKPVFHTGDPWELAEVHYTQARYLGIGMSQDLSETERVRFAVRVAKRLGGRQLHGLAATGHRMLRAAPWYSVDSAAWIQSAAMGGINWTLPGGKLISIAISDQSPRRKEFDAHYNSLAPIVQDAIRAQVEASGVRLEDLQRTYQHRWLWNIGQYRAAVDAAAAFHKSGQRVMLEEDMFYA